MQSVVLRGRVRQGSEAPTLGEWSNRGWAGPSMWGWRAQWARGSAEREDYVSYHAPIHTHLSIIPVKVVQWWSAVWRGRAAKGWKPRRSSRPREGSYLCICFIQAEWPR